MMQMGNSTQRGEKRDLRGQKKRAQKGSAGRVSTTIFPTGMLSREDAGASPSHLQT